MTSQDWQRLKALFEEARELSAEQKARFVQQIREEDDELGRELESLLRADGLPTVPVSISFPAMDQNLDGAVFREGQVILGRFEIVRLLGAGGMGEVYEANDREMGRIAIKTVRQDSEWKHELVRRLRREVQLARKITSPFVCRIYEFFPVPARAGEPEIACLTMEYLEGKPLSQHLAASGAMARADFRKLAVQICQGLQAIHGAGIIHRDLKTANIMLADRGNGIEAVVMDFGLARRSFAMQASVGGSIVQSAGLAGTPNYMAPEQFHGGELTTATDIYALGIILYEMATGKHPYPAGDLVQAAALRGSPLKIPSSVCAGTPRSWDGVIARCLQFDQASRYQNASDICAALNDGDSALNQLSRPVLRFAGRHRVATVVTALALFIAVIGAVFVYPFRLDPHSVNALAAYNKGVNALGEGTYLAAANNMQAAIGYDKDFALAHVRLAEAWAELDFTGKAEHEMLLASTPDSLRQIRGRDRDYFQAIRAFVTEDFADAVRAYERILRELPRAEKGVGYLDLGRAQERAGNIAEALRDYETATKFPPESPAPYLRRAILEGRGNDVEAANRDFAKADSLYRIAPNLEGLAEVNYQRGYFESKRNHPAEARPLIEKSLRAAQEIPNLQLEIRAITRLAVIAYLEDKYDEAIRLAKQAIETARENGLDYWAIDARVRLGNTYAYRGDIQSAESNLQDALRLAEQGQRPRLRALAAWSLANLRSQEAKPAETITYAQTALAYYKKEGFAEESLQALRLIGWSELQASRFKEALITGLQSVKIAKAFNDPAAVYPSEELLASSFLALQDYPNALAHFQAALAASIEAKSQEAYEYLHCADTLWQLGQYGEAQQMLRAIPSTEINQPDIVYGANCTLSQLYLSQNKYDAALAPGRRALSAAGALGAGRRIEPLISLALADAGMGSEQAALQALDEAVAAAREIGRPEVIAEVSLTSGIVQMEFGHLSEAKLSAAAAWQFFSQSGQKESQFRTLHLLATILHRTGDSTKCKEFAQKALDILAELEHTWGTPICEVYMRRPDIQGLIAELRSFTGREKG